MISFYLLLRAVSQVVGQGWTSHDGQSPEAVPGAQFPVELYPGAAGSRGVVLSPRAEQEQQLRGTDALGQGERLQLSPQTGFRPGCCGRLPSLVILSSLTLV